MNKLLNFSDYLLDGFDEDISQLEKYRGRKTGFMNLDRQAVFVPALYFLGGLPGMGKSTFAWQLAYQLARADEHVVYCSYEMPAEALASKMIAREMARRYGVDSGLCVPANKIRLGAYKDNLEVYERVDCVRNEVCKPACKTLSVIHCDCPIEDLIKLLMKAAQSAGDKPFVAVVDYLQLVGVKDNKVSSVRDRIDFIIAQLKRFQQETNSTVVVLSAFNRASNVGGIETKLSSFKESGGIEYTGEVLWGLEPREAAGMAVEKIPEFLKQTPREMQLVCVKNRYGGLYEAYFNYYPAFDYFDYSTTPAFKAQSKPNIGTDI